MEKTNGDMANKNLLLESFRRRFLFYKILDLFTPPHFKLRDKIAY
jgi:hypothetical protein